MMWNWGYGSWWMGLTMVLFWAGVIALVVWAVRSSNQPASRGHDPRRRAIEVLEERYARGDIDDEEFRRRRALLEDTSVR